MNRPAYKVGDYVSQPAKPEWGPGRVLHVAGDTVTVYFRDEQGGDPDLAVKKIKVDRVPLAHGPCESDPILDNLPPYRNGKFERLPQKRVTFREGLSKFRSLFPLHFEDPKYIGDLKEGERAYKWAAHELFRETLGNGELSSLVEAGDVDTARRLLLAVEGRVNLLSRFEKAALRDAMQDDEAANGYMLALSRLLEAGTPEREHFELYIRAVEALPSAEGKTDPAKWPVATVFPYLAEPRSFMFMKPKVTQDCAARLMFELNYSPTLNWLSYAKLLEMSRYLLEELRSYGARDFIDVQSFIYVVGGGWDDV